MWRMCVSYKDLNNVTRPFVYSILRCDNDISIFQVGSCIIGVITVDARYGYHQVAVRIQDREKLASFRPDDNKYCYNAPSFYSCMMDNLNKECDALFVERLEDKATSDELLDNKPGTMSNGDIFLASKQLYIGIKSIIDDILT